MEETAVGVAAEAPHMSFFERLVGIFFEPGRTFEDIRRNRSWLAMLLLVSLVSVCVNYTLQWRMDPADMALKGLAMSKPILKKFLGPEQMAQAEAQAEQRALQPRGLWSKYSPIVLTPVMMFITYFVIAAILLLAYVLMSAGINLRKAFTATLWGMSPPAIVVTLLSLIFIFVKDPKDLDIVPIYNVISNLGLLVDFGTHPVLNSLLSSIDLFTIWTIVLLSLGFSAMSEKKLSPGKAAVPLVCLWGVWVLLKMGFWAVLS
jgi:hypothetical protein